MLCPREPLSVLIDHDFRPSVKVASGGSIAISRGVVFPAATARRFGPHRGEHVHYFLSGNPMAHTRNTPTKVQTRTQKSSVKMAGRPVWAEISASALTHNLRAIRDYVNPAEEKRQTPRLVLSIVKGNGYGHGGPQVAKILDKAGSDWFGVTCTSEGIAVRKAWVRRPILVLTSFWPGEEASLVKHDLTPVVHRCEQLHSLNQAAAKHGRRKPVSFHPKMDTGMNRLGILPSDVDCCAGQLAKCRNLRLGGVLTPFASSEAFSPASQGEQTREQEEH